MTPVRLYKLSLYDNNGKYKFTLDQIFCCAFKNINNELLVITYDKIYNLIIINQEVVVSKLKQDVIKYSIVVEKDNYIQWFRSILKELKKHKNLEFKRIIILFNEYIKVT